ncbi:MAG: DUF86 domain-containing protein [Fibromonadaceae bacterium]|jgi:uncharacterized protein with HEPN domain|nr:DUF86 domain-containing protein [Fibromonadaceae bacterium]
MLSHRENDLLYLLNILEYSGKIWKYTENIISAEEFYEFNDQLNLNASLTLLANIGEDVGKISQELKQEYQDIEWQSIKNFRNKIVHNYAGIDIDIVFEIITKDLRILKPKIEKIISKKLEEKIFNIDEWNSAKESEFYKYVDFASVYSNSDASVKNIVNLSFFVMGVR